MKKLMLVAGLAFLATAATPALAQGRYYPGPGYGSRSPTIEHYRQLRACQRHDRVHRQLDRAHAGEHYQGLESRGDHYDQHGALGEAHEGYHYERPRADWCDRYTTAPRYRSGGRTPYGGYGYYDRGYGKGGYYDRGYGPQGY